MSRRREEKLKEKGYHLADVVNTKDEAMEKAKEYRKSGYYAQVVEYATSVRGYHDYGVWIKKRR